MRQGDQKRRSAPSARAEAWCGAVILIQRLMAAGNLNIHLRCLVLNGPVRLSHTRLLEYVFDIDPEYRPNCDGVLKIIAAIRGRSMIESILTHLDLRARASDCFEARTSW